MVVCTQEKFYNVKQEYDENFIRQEALGELDHQDSSVVNYRTFLIMSKSKLGGDNLLGAVEVVGTPASILKELFEGGIKLGISSRGMGSVENVVGADKGKKLEMTLS